jgi:hypothetical protein
MGDTGGLPKVSSSIVVGIAGIAGNGGGQSTRLPRRRVPTWAAGERVGWRVGVQRHEQRRGRGRKEGEVSEQESKRARGLGILLSPASASLLLIKSAPAHRHIALPSFRITRPSIRLPSPPIRHAELSPHARTHARTDRIVEYTPLHPFHRCVSAL